MRTNIIRACFFATLISVGAQAQQNLVYNHYFINPFLYNPSYVAPNGYTELNLNYRKQWSGISGAPTTGTLNLHIPLNYKAGIAFTAYQDEAGLLLTTGGLVSFAYQIHFGKKLTDVHKLSFGLSAGAMNSRIDAGKADDINDPVLGNSTTSLDGQVGIHYRYNGLRAGFAIPRIFDTRVASEKSFNQSGIAQLNATITSLSYDFRVGPRLSIEPMVTYRTFENLDPQLEGLATVKLSNVGWIGGAYRQNYGGAAFLGFSILEKYKVGYAYEFAMEQTDRIGNGTHEVQLVVRLGKKQFARAVRSTTAAAATTPPQPTQQAEATIQPIEEEITDQEVLVSTPSESQPRSIDPVDDTSLRPLEQTSVDVPDNGTAQVVQEQQPEAPTAVTSIDGEDLRPGHYVVVGAFQSMQNAMNYQRTLKKSGYPAHVAFDPSRKYYIVHMDQANSLEQARKLRDKYREMSRYSFRDTWILSVE